jgi:hypothetical protein
VRFDQRDLPIATPAFHGAFTPRGVGCLVVSLEIDETIDVVAGREASLCFVAVL